MKTFTTVKETWDFVIEDCLNAKKTIIFEQFLLSDFDEGEIGKTLGDIFIKKAEEGIEVHLHLDFIGSQAVHTSQYLEEFKKSGINITFTSFKLKHFLPHNFLKLRRNHRKLIVIDKEIVYVGGVVFYEDVRDWNDYQVRFENYAEKFMQIFNLSQSEKDEDSKFNPHLNKDLKAEVNDFEHRYITKSILEKINSAQNKITIITPYFSPPKKILTSLYEASERGVKVKVLIPYKTDHFLARMAHFYYVKKLSKTKIEILADTSKMNHSKIIFIDDWVTFGSCNFDRISLLHNKELNISSDSKVIFDMVEKDTKIFLEKSMMFFNNLYLKNNFVKRNFMRLGGWVFQKFT